MKNVVGIESYLKSQVYKSQPKICHSHATLDDGQQIRGLGSITFKEEIQKTFVSIFRGLLIWKNYQQ